MPLWTLAHGRSLDLSAPRLMAIVNVTPDSFSDGGRYASVSEAVTACAEFVAAGADMLDVGGESTRPGAARVAPVEQVERVVPVIEALRRDPRFDGTPISVDTTMASVARAALDAGADAVNDVSGLGDDGPAMLELLGASDCGYILMHRLRPPEADSYSDRYAEAPRYGDVVAEVKAALRAGLERLDLHGVARERVVLDPGLGFGKTVEQNLELIRRSGELLRLGLPLLSGLSRKSFVGRWALNRDSEPSERLKGTLRLSAEHVRQGARLLRVHDVSAHASLGMSSA
ncbi:MAG: dihydropteroate synthase [Phycisphaerales bacterium]|nr:dihydropteroate synthase [Phycisphaerales bacterium]